MTNFNKLKIDSAGLRLECILVPWDSATFGFPVGQITFLEVLEVELAKRAFQKAWEWVSRSGIRMISCRLGNDRLNESIFLEEQGFRFIEIVLHPQLIMIGKLNRFNVSLSIKCATEADMPYIENIALTAFRHERCHVDPRLEPGLGNRRYANWVRSSLKNPSQQLFKILDDSKIVAFFLVEIEGTKAYWHLTAVAPRHQGKGYGERAWMTMLAHHQQEGVTEVNTTISARNCRVLNLYCKLCFRFQPPEMTFHWVR
jgi:ribosomal protein S18 acetylase RimI-like enzyme